MTSQLSGTQATVSVTIFEQMTWFCMMLYVIHFQKPLPKTILERCRPNVRLFHDWARQQDTLGQGGNVKSA